MPKNNQNLESIESAELKIKQIFKAKYPERNFDKDIIETHKDYYQKDTAEETISRAWTLLLHEEQKISEICLILLQHAYILTKQAKSAKEKGNLTEPSEIFINITHLIRLAEQPEYAPSYNEADRRKEIARSGGIKRRENLKPAKEEAARLLRKNKPSNGWKNPSEAVSGIKEELFKFIKSQNINLGITGLPATVKRWLKKDPSLQATIKETMSLTPQRETQHETKSSTQK